MDRELRRQRRMAMRGVPERLALSFAGGGIEMRAKPNGTAAGSAFEWNGYAAVYGTPFDMYDPWGERYTESVAPGACRRSLANPNLDVPFLVGHNDAGIPLARTKSGTMQLAEDSHGLHVHVPSMDGRREEVRALASAVERGDMDEMSLAFICLTPPDQQWDAAMEHRTVGEMDLHRGDVCAVVHGANSATAGASMFPVEQLAFRRPAAIGGPVLLERRDAASLAAQHGHPGRPCVDPDHDGDCDATPQGDTDHDYWTADGQQIKPLPGEDDQYIVNRPYELRAAHGPFTGTHSHPHPAMGSQGGDGTHEHAHSHDGDASHSHGHEDRAQAGPYELRCPALAKFLDAAKAGHKSGAMSTFDSDISDSGKNATHELGAAIHRLVQWAGSGNYPEGTSYADLKSMYAKICAELKHRDPHSTAGGNFPPEHHASGMPLETRASAAEDDTLSFASDYNAAPVAGLTCPRCKTGNHGGAKFCNQCGHSFGTGASVTVDDSTGIPGEETQLAAARKLELMARELELEELAAAR